MPDSCSLLHSHLPENPFQTIGREQISHSGGLSTFGMGFLVSPFAIHFHLFFNRDLTVDSKNSAQLSLL